MKGYLGSLRLDIWLIVENQYIILATYPTYPIGKKYYENY